MQIFVIMVYGVVLVFKFNTTGVVKYAFNSSFNSLLLVVVSLPPS